MRLQEAHNLICLVMQQKDERIDAFTDPLFNLKLKKGQVTNRGKRFRNVTHDGLESRAETASKNEQFH